MGRPLGRSIGETVPYTVRLPVDVRAALRREAQRRGITQTAAVVDALRAWLARD